MQLVRTYPRLASSISPHADRAAENRRVAREHRARQRHARHARRLRGPGLGRGAALLLLPLRARRRHGRRRHGGRRRLRLHVPGRVAHQGAHALRVVARRRARRRRRRGRTHHRQEGTAPAHPASIAAELNAGTARGHVAVGDHDRDVRGGVRAACRGQQGLRATETAGQTMMLSPTGSPPFHMLGRQASRDRRGVRDSR